MVSTAPAIIHNSTHSSYQDALAGSYENRGPSKSIIHTTKSKLSSLSKSLYQRAVLLIETVSPYIKSISAGLNTLKNYSIRGCFKNA